MNADDITEYRAAGRTWTHPLPLTLGGCGGGLAYVTGHPDLAFVNWGMYLIIGRLLLGVGRFVGIAERPARRDFINHPVTVLAGLVGAAVGYANTRDPEGLLLGGALWTVVATVAVASWLLIRANLPGARRAARSETGSETEG